MLTIFLPAPTDDEATIKVASTKKSVTPRPQSFGKLKLRKPPPKQAKPGNWKEANVIEGSLHSYFFLFCF